MNWRDVLGRFSGTPFAHFIVESKEVSTKTDDEDDNQEANMDMRVGWWRSGWPRRRKM